MKNAALLFDLDGTLIDSRADIANAMNATLERYRLPVLSMEKVISFVGDGAKNLVVRALQGAKTPPDEVCGVFLEEYMKKSVVKTTLYPGVRETLETLYTDNWNLAVLSNKPQALCEKILEELGVRKFFRIVIGGGSGFSLKPSPEALKHILETTGSAPEHSWMIGDHWTDMATGRNGGVRTAFALYGIGNVKEEKPTVCFDSFSELPDIVGQGGNRL